MTPRDWTPTDAADAADAARDRHWWRSREPEFTPAPEGDGPEEDCRPMTPENKALFERELGPFVRDTRTPLPPPGMAHITVAALDQLLTAAREDGRGAALASLEDLISKAPRAQEGPLICLSDNGRHDLGKQVYGRQRREILAALCAGEVNEVGVIVRAYDVDPDVPSWARSSRIGILRYELRSRGFAGHRVVFEHLDVDSLHKGQREAIGGLVHDAVAPKEIP